MAAGKQQPFPSGGNLGDGFSDDVGYKVLALLMHHQGLDHVHIPMRVLENFAALADSRGGMLALLQDAPGNDGLVLRLVDLVEAEKILDAEAPPT